MRSRAFESNHCAVIMLYLGSIHLTLRNRETVEMHDGPDDAIFVDRRMKVEDVRMSRATGAAPPPFRPEIQRKGFPPPSSHEC